MSARLRPAAAILAALIAAQPVAAAPPRDGAHDFDFDLGAWHTHSSRLLHPLTGSRNWIELDGQTIVTPIWGGKGNLAEYKADGSNGPLELLAIRLYDPKARQWTINFATPGVGALGNVPGVGAVQDGRMTFYDQEEIGGRMTLVRFQIWPITRDTAQSEQAFSADGGTTWEVNWVNKYERIKG
jgi:hypothetical protein